MNKNYYNPNKDGIKIRSINLCMVILCFVLCAGVFVSAFQLKSKYNDIIKNIANKIVDGFFQPFLRLIFKISKNSCAKTIKTILPNVLLLFCVFV